MRENNNIWFYFNSKNWIRTIDFENNKEKDTKIKDYKICTMWGFRWIIFDEEKKGQKK